MTDEERRAGTLKLACIVGLTVMAGVQFGFKAALVAAFSLLLINTWVSFR